MVRKPNSVSSSAQGALSDAATFGRMTTIPLRPALLTGSSDLPGSGGRAVRCGRSACAHRPRAPLFGLAPCGVLPATCLTAGAVRSYRTFSPLPFDPPLHGSLRAGPKAASSEAAKRRVERRYVFCATFLRVAPTGSYPAHCPVEFGLSSLQLATSWLAQGPGGPASASREAASRTAVICPTAADVQFYREAPPARLRRRFPG